MTTNPAEHAAYELLAQELTSINLPSKGDTVATFQPLDGPANEEYRDALSEKLKLVFGKGKVSVGNAVKNGGIEVIITRGAGVRSKLAEIMARESEVER